MNVEIKNRFTGAVIFGGEFASLRTAVIAAVKARADLTDADLTGADLTDARNLGETNGSEAHRPERADRKERAKRRAERFRARNPDVPVIPDLDAQILAVIASGAGRA